jgi:methylenetetrahydrofolate dehydrogenase (NADP+)/methenyltetrahydrofolate cyclohydrolase
MARLLEGAPVADAVLEDVAARTCALVGRGITPGLGVILVGDNPASIGYIRGKRKACERVGVAFHLTEIPGDASQRDLIAAVERLNDDPDVHSFLVQYPVPDAFDFGAAVCRIDPDKDADGLHPVNLGKLVLQQAGPRPCTPMGIQAMLKHYGIPVAGREVVIIGRGPTLGRPLALILSLKEEGANAVVTVVHSGVRDLSSLTRRAEILVAAVGRPSIVTPDMVKPGAVVISGGISFKGRKLLPDVDESCTEVAGWITPRLGGVGPTTVAMLLRNTVEAAERRAATS